MPVAGPLGCWYSRDGLRKIERCGMIGGTEEALAAVDRDRARAVVFAVFADDSFLAHSSAEAASSSVATPLVIVSSAFAESGGAEETASSFDTSAAASASDVPTMIQLIGVRFCSLARRAKKLLAISNMPMSRSSSDETEKYL
jgi:hypothetical protein